MTTNLHYLIAGMAVLLVVLWQYSHQRQMDDRNSLMFRRLLTVVSLDVLAELVSTCFILYAPYSFGVGRMLSNTVFYLFQAILPLMLLYYVCTLCSSRVISTGTVLRMGIPTIALVFIILTNPFTEKLFYFDSTGYCHGPWYLLLYISALLHIDCMSVSRISSPADRVSVGQQILCAIKNRDAQGRFVLTIRELLGTWAENAARFTVGETVVGIVRSVEEYGTFVEIAPNLAGLAESCSGLAPGQAVSVYIKNILPDKMKIKLVIVNHSLGQSHRFDLRYFITEGHIDHWLYSTPESRKRIETDFAVAACNPA